MGLTLITGRAVTGKTGVLHRAVIQAAVEGRRAVLLVPSFVDVRRSRAEIASRAPLGVEIATLDRWAEGLWSLYGDGRRLVGDATRRSVVREALTNEPINPMASRPGYRELVASVAARSAGTDLPQARKKSHQALLSNVASYRSRCRAHGLVERGEVLEFLADSSPLHDMVVGVNRFTDLSPGQLAFIEGLAACNEVLLALNWAPGSPATDALTPAVEACLASGANHRHLPDPDPSSELEYVERQLFSPVAPITSTGAVEFMTAAGDEAEAALVARAAARAVQEGIAPHEIAVTFRDVARRELLVTAALAAEGLQCELDMAVPFERSTLGRSLSALMSAVRGEGGRDAILTFLHSPYSGASGEGVEALDAWARTNRILEMERLINRAKELSPATESAFRLARAVHSEALDGRGAGAWKSLIDRLVENGLSRHGRLDAEIRLDGSAHRLVIEAAGELAATSTGENRASVLLDYLAGSAVHSGGEEREGAVYVTEAHRLRSRRFRMVVIGGLTADEFSSEKREPLTARVLGDLGLPAGTEERLSERLLFYSVATRARERLILIRQSSTSTGAALRASAFWEEMNDLYRTAEQAEAGIQAVEPTETLPLSRLEMAAPALTSGRRGLRQLLVVEAAHMAEAPRGAIATTPWADVAREFSATEIETYLSCPYRWFYDRIVRPGELDTGFEARERGALVHSVLAEFYRQFVQEQAARVTPELLPRAHALLTEVWERVSGEYEKTTRGLAEKLALRSALEWARDAVTQDALLFQGFSPVAQEWRFGEGVERPFSRGDVRLKGAIDRVDSGGAGLIVTDYKSGSTVVGRKSWQNEGLIQVVIYGEVASKQLGRPVVGGFYRSLVSGDLRGFWNIERAQPEEWVSANDRVTEQEYLELVDLAWSSVQSSADGIRQAAIAPRPLNGKACEWCGANPFCGEVRR